ncbi:MAG: hypothetical protein C0404_12900 [Verrucomicrobia bacterium]|nr:hypothetical protein [Verrucomicrobiota bacterium]
MKNILLVNPEFPPIHQSFDFVLPMLEARFIAPPLSLLTVAALIPAGNNLRLVDMNVKPLTDGDLAWADVVLITGIGAQAVSMLKTARRCKEHSPDIRLIMGGLHVSVFSEKFLQYADAIVCGESEAVMGQLFGDIESGSIHKFYNEKLECVDIHRSPCPMFKLVNPADYLIWTMQYSRGCPHNCEFCELPRFYGHRPREKSVDQFVAEMTAVYDLGFRGTIMLGDDNFHRTPHVRDLLPAMTAWQRARGYPFMFFTQTDIRIADEPELMDRMAEAGFTSLQIGLESPSPDALKSMGKVHNIGIDLVDAVRTIHSHGLEVQPAMLLGMDGDPPNIGDLQFEFLQKAGTPRSMISVLRVFKGSRLYATMEKEGRILCAEPSGDQTGDFVLNYKARMGNDRLLDEAVKLLKRLYEPRNYFQRCWICLGTVRRLDFQKHPISRRSLRWVWNYLKQSRAPLYNAHFVLLLLRTLLLKPRKLKMGIALGMLGYHYNKMASRARVGVREPVKTEVE